MREPVREGGDIEFGEEVARAGLRFGGVLTPGSRDHLEVFFQRQVAGQRRYSDQCRNAGAKIGVPLRNRRLGDLHDSRCWLLNASQRSEERRVGKECTSGWAAQDEKNKVDDG